MSRVLVVGCGCTGALIAALLRRNKKLINITMWDKSKGAGGRMSTSRSPQDNSCTADLGCQYITQHSSYLNKHSSYYEELKNASILVPLNTEIEYAKNNENNTNYVTPAGVSSIVKYYIKESQCCSSYQMQLDSIVKKEGSWMVKAIDGTEGVFDSVVLTIPVPQLFLLQGDMPSILSASSQVKSNLEEVDYSSRYALGLFFDKGVKLDEPWSGKYVNDHPIFRFIAIDNKKRGQAESPPSVVFHTSVPFGKQHLEKTPTEVEPILLKAIKEMFPNWPAPSSVKTQKWRYSQVSKPYPGSPGCVVLSENPPLVLAGDGFSHSNFDGCIVSAEAVLKEIEDKL